MSEDISEEFAQLGSLVICLQARVQILSHGLEALLALLPDTQRQEWLADFSKSATHLSLELAPLANSQVDEQMALQVAALLDAAGRPPRT